MIEHPDQTFHATQGTAGQSNSRVRDFIKNAAAYSIIAASLGIGATLASIFWSTSNASLLAELRHSQEEVRRLSDELDHVRDAADIPPAGEILAPGYWKVTVRLGSTMVMDSDLFISVISIERSSNGATVFATIAASGSLPMKIDRATVGDTFTYNASRKNFEIRIVKVDSFSATFLIKEAGR
jgi:hypothetical protein